MCYYQVPFIPPHPKMSAYPNHSLHLPFTPKFTSYRNLNSKLQFHSHIYQCSNVRFFPLKTRSRDLDTDGILVLVTVYMSYKLEVTGPVFLNCSWKDMIGKWMIRRRNDRNFKSKQKLMCLKTGSLWTVRESSRHRTLQVSRSCSITSGWFPRRPQYKAVLRLGAVFIPLLLLWW